MDMGTPRFFDHSNSRSAKVKLGYGRTAAFRKILRALGLRNILDVSTRNKISLHSLRMGTQTHRFRELRNIQNSSTMYIPRSSKYCGLKFSPFPMVDLK